jgi:hypothetical protein
MALTKEGDDASGAAAAYDAQEEDLLINTRKIIARQDAAQHGKAPLTLVR